MIGCDGVKIRFSSLDGSNSQPSIYRRVPALVDKAALYAQKKKSPVN